ncbi:MAG: patatin-like phospholipase family protein [Bryobacteraceae bacterium]
MADFDAVFEGGGAKGAVFVGALQVLEERGHRLRRLIGTSAGAITAALAAAGYSAGDMLEVVKERVDGKPRFCTFMDIPSAASFTEAIRSNSVTLGILRDIDTPFAPNWLEERADQILLDALLKNRVYARFFSFVECGGFYSGETFRAWLEEKLQDRGVTPQDTLETFARKTGSDLSLVVTDTADMEMLVLNRRTAPNVPVSWAVRMSMSIPFVWQQVVWNPAWGDYLGRSKAGNVIVDGGMLSNFPIRLIAETGADIPEIMGDTSPTESANVGLLIDENLPVAGEPDTPKTPNKLSSLRTIQRLSRMVDTMTGASDNAAIRRYEAEICRLPAKGYGTLEFDMEGPRLENFLQAGRDAMTKHLAARAAAAIA